MKPIEFNATIKSKPAYYNKQNKKNKSKPTDLIKKNKSNPTNIYKINMIRNLKECWRKATPPPGPIVPFSDFYFYHGSAS